MKSPIEGHQIPQDWQIAPISRLADFRRGISWRKQDESSPREGTLVVSIPNIKDGWIDYESKFNHYIDIDIPESKLLSEGDVVFVGSSGSIHNVGRNARISQATENRIAFASFTFRARPHPSIVDSHFFYFLVNSDLVPFQAFCKRAADGKFNFQLGDFSSRLAVPLPPLAEQEAIARDLAAVKRAIEAQERIIQTTTELKQALMQKLFSEGLRGEPQKETEIGLVPESWEVVRFEHSVNIKNGQVDPRRTPFAELLHVGPENIESNTGRLSSLQTNAELKISSGNYHFTPADILYSKIRPYLNKVALPDFEGTCSADMYPLRPSSRFTREFLFYYLLSDDFRKAAISFQDRTGIPKINRMQLGSIRLPCPLKEEQNEIAVALGACDGKLRAAQAKSESLQNVFRTLLYELMSAKIQLHSNTITKSE